MASFLPSVGFRRVNAARGGRPMAKKRDWEDMRTMSARLLDERTGEGVAAWNRRIQKERLDDETSLRAWLSKHGVTGYAQTLLVMERFGYPDSSLRPRTSSSTGSTRTGGNCDRSSMLCLRRPHA